MKFFKSFLFAFFVFTISGMSFSAVEGSHQSDSDDERTPQPKVVFQEIEDDLLSAYHQRIANNSDLTANSKFQTFKNLERPENQYGYGEERLKIGITDLSAMSRIYLLEEIIKFSVKKGINSTYFTIGEHHYKLYLNPTHIQKGNGVIAGLREYSETGGNRGETYLNILEELKKIPSKNINLLKECLIEQKKDGQSLKVKNLGFDRYGKIHAFYARYLDGFNLLLDYEVARRRINAEDPHFKLPLLLSTYILLDNLNNTELLTKCLGGGDGGESYLFGGANRKEFILEILSTQVGHFTKCDLQDAAAIQNFLITTFSKTAPAKALSSEKGKAEDKEQTKKHLEAAEQKKQSKVKVRKKTAKPAEKTPSKSAGSQLEEVSSEDEPSTKSKDKPKSQANKKKQLAKETPSESARSKSKEVESEDNIPAKKMTKDKATVKKNPTKTVKQTGTQSKLKKSRNINSKDKEKDTESDNS